MSDRQRAVLPTGMIAVVLILVIWLASFTAAQTPPTTTTSASTQTTQTSQTQTTLTFVNLAVIPNDWGDYKIFGDCRYDGGVQITHVDYNILHNGHVSIRIDPHTSADPNSARECDGIWYTVAAGYHVIFKCWEKTGLSQNPAYNNDPTNSYGYGASGAGARIGMDFYGTTGNLGIGALVNGLGSDTVTIPGYPRLQSAFSAVPCNTTNWKQQVIDFIVPAGYGITQIVGWIQMRPESGDTVQGWFADAELYISR